LFHDKGAKAYFINLFPASARNVPSNT